MDDGARRRLAFLLQSLPSPPIPLVAFPDLVSSATRDLDPSILHHLPSLAFSHGTSGLVWGLRKPRNAIVFFVSAAFGNCGKCNLHLVAATPPMDVIVLHCIS